MTTREAVRLSRGDTVEFKVPGKSGRTIKVLVRNNSKPMSEGVVVEFLNGSAKGTIGVVRFEEFLKPTASVVGRPEYAGS